MSADRAAHASAAKETMKQTVAVLAYGSLIANPGEELRRATVDTREGVTTPFNVEFARASSKRRGAPTLVYESGIPGGCSPFPFEDS